MSRFKRIKSKTTKKSSVSINEKIFALNKELEKTGMLSERMTTSNVYSRSQFVPAQDAVISNVPDGNGLVDGTWTQPLGTAYGGGVVDAAPTSFPKFWNNAGYRTPVSGIVNTDNLHGDGANLGVAKMPNNGEPFETEVSPTLRAAGAVGGFVRYYSGFNAGWRSGYMAGGTRDSGGGTFNAYSGQSTGGRYSISHLGVDNVTPSSHPHLFRAVNYWHPFSIFNPDIDARWPLGDVGPKYTGTVTEINGVKYALFTAYKWIGDGANTYTAQQSRPATTLLIQRQGIGDINYHGPITPGGMFGLSDQGYNYLSGRAKRSRRTGLQTLRGAPIYRKAGSGGVRRKVTSMSGGLIPLGRGGKVSSRGVGNVLRGKGVGFSPSANRVSKNVAKELPPKPTKAEIRKTTVDEFRKNGDNLAANRFYTEDRISELEGKEKLTSSEQSELDQLKVNAVHMNQVSPPPEQVMSQAQEAKEEIYNDKSEIKPTTTFENIINDGGLLPKGVEAVKNLFDSFKSGELGEKILSVLPEKGLITGKTPYEKIDYMADGVDKAVTALNDVLDKVVPEATQKTIDSTINAIFDGFVDNFIEPDLGDRAVASNLLQTYDEVLNDPNYDGSPVDITKNLSKDDINAIKGIVTDDIKQLREKYLNTDDPNLKEKIKESIQSKLNSGIQNLSTGERATSLGYAFGPGGTTADVDKFIEENKLIFNDNYAFRHDPGIATNQFVSSIARLLGVSNDTVPMDSNLINTIAVPLMAKLMLRPPDDGTNRSWTENIEAAPSIKINSAIEPPQ